MSTSLEAFNDEATRLARYYGVPMELIGVHALSLAAAMARRVVRSVGRPPVLPLLIQTDQALPEWMEREWRAVETQLDMEASKTLLQHPASVAADRRRRRILMMLDPDGCHLTEAFALQMRSNSRPVFGRMAITRSSGRLTVQPAGQPITHLTAGLQRLRPVLRRVIANPGEESLIGWINSRDFKNLVRSEDPEVVQHVGLVIRGTESQVAEQLSSPPAPLIALVHSQFIGAAVAARNKWSFNPEGPALALLEAHTARIEQLVANMPPELRPAQPDPLRTWHMAALLAFLAGGPDRTTAEEAAVETAIRLGDWAAAEHLKCVRAAWPADQEGRFADQDLRIYRQLTQSPQPVRNIQRALKGVDKDRCLAALNRASAAGLAVEQPTGRFALIAN